MIQLLTNEQMLKEIVQRGLDGDWRPDNIECADMKSCTNSHVTFTYESTATEILYGAELTVTLPPLSVPDLIDDDDFMKSVFGVEMVCILEADMAGCMACHIDCHDDSLFNPGVFLLPRYQDIQSRAIRFSGDAQVKYLHKMMKEKK